MGARGPNPTSKSKQFNPVSHYPAGAPPMPRGLSAAARRHWKFLVKVLLDAGRLSPVDGPSLERLVRSEDRVRACDRQLDEEGFTVLSVYGDREIVKPHPCVSIREKAAAECERLSRKFALTPLDRASVRTLVEGRASRR